MHIELFEQSDCGGPAYDIKTELSFLVRFGTNHPSRRRHVTLNAITNVLSVAALRMTSLITRVRTPYVTHEMDRYQTEVPSECGRVS